MSTSPGPAEVHTPCTDPRLKAILRSRTEEWWQIGDRYVASAQLVLRLH